MQFQRENLLEIVDEIGPLLHKHWREVAHYQDIELDPDWEGYARAEAAGGLRTFTVRENGQLVGYAIFFVRHNLHYKQSLQASQDVIFLDPAHRGARYGAALISFADGQLRSEGVQAVYHHVKAAHNFGPLLESQGYHLVDLIYARRLDTKEGE